MATIVSRNLVRVVALVAGVTGCADRSLSGHSDGEPNGVPAASDTPDAASPSCGGDPCAPAAVRFYPDIQSDLVTLSCTTGGACHGSAQPPIFRQSPQTDVERNDNFMSFVGECNAIDPAKSPIIQNALGNMSHVGGTLMKMTDPQYQRWIAWIADGELE
jgi:hypothetical protein